jgi:uncharacterized protein (DUF2267 family)
MQLRTSARGLTAVAAGIATIATALLAATPRGRRLVRHLARRTAARSRYAAGRARGLRYRLLRRGPSEDVSDAVLVQRIRSSLGPLEKRLDLPHVHVTACNGSVTLHGVAATAEQAQQLEDAVRAVAGVKGLEDRLHLGLTPADTRPSEGRVPADSAMRRELQAEAHGLGLGIQEVAAVLGVFLHRLPRGERDHVLAHLPADVRALTGAVAPAGVERISDEAALIDAVATSAAISHVRADGLIRAVLEVLRERVPEEIGDVHAVLPTGLKPLWAHPTREAAP